MSLSGGIVSRQNLQKESPGRVISDAEIWLAIRYLDPDLRRKRSEITPYLALVMVIVLLCAVWFSLHLRGL
jgi:hypothetical protein